VRIEAAFVHGPGTPPSHLRVDEARLYRVVWIRDVRAACDADAAPDGWFVATVEAYSDIEDETLTLSFIVGPHADDPGRADWGSMQPSATEETSLNEHLNDDPPASSATSPPNRGDITTAHTSSGSVVDLVTDANWRRTTCIVCRKRIVRVRDAHNMIGGTLDGKWLAFWPSGPDRLAMTGPVPTDATTYLLGAVHRGCLAVAPERIRAGSVHLDPVLPELSYDEWEDAEYTAHLPADESTCPFCGNTGPMTDEHIWPIWLSKELRRLGATFVALQGTKSAPASIDVTVGVCRQCNNDWLSTLENDVATIARPMLRGHRVRLHTNEQGRLATWATKTAYLLDRTSSPIVPRGFPMELAIRREPPSNTCVFLAAYDGSRAAYASFERLHVAGPDGLRPTEPNVFVATFTAHTLAFQVMGHFNTGGWQLNDDRAGLRDGLLQIWPALHAEVTWPPQLLLPDRGIEALAKSITE
jgi:hypothetical protein